MPNLGSFSNILFSQLNGLPDEQRKIMSKQLINMIQGNGSRQMKRSNQQTTTTTTTSTIYPNDDILKPRIQYDINVYDENEYAVYTFNKQENNNYYSFMFYEPIEPNDDLTIINVGGGGSGATPTDNWYTGGGGGGGVALINLSTTQPMRLELFVGQGGPAVGSAQEGDNGLESLCNIIGFSGSGSDVYLNISSKGGSGGLENAGGNGGNASYSNTSQGIITINNYALYNGGNGGNYYSNNGNGYPISMLGTSSNYPTYLDPELYSTGGGGSQGNPSGNADNADGYWGGMGGGNQRSENSTNTDPRLGGIRGRGFGNDYVKEENGTLTEITDKYLNGVLYNGVYGGAGLYNGCGGGAGGADPNEAISYKSGPGADGIIKILIKKDSAYKIGNSIVKGFNDPYYYWIIQSNIPLYYSPLKNLKEVSMLLVGSGGGGASITGGNNDSNGGGGGGLTVATEKSINIDVNNGDIYFIAGSGGSGSRSIGNQSSNNGRVGDNTIYDNLTGKYIHAGGGGGGTYTAGGAGGINYSVSGYITGNYVGGLGGDRSNGYNSIYNTTNTFPPSQITNVLSWNGIPLTYGGGGGGSKEHADDYTYTGGEGSVSGVGGQRGTKGDDVYASNGSNGRYGGGGGAGGFNATTDQGYIGGNGGNGLIVLWVDKKNVS